MKFNKDFFFTKNQPDLQNPKLKNLLFYWIIFRPFKLLNSYKAPPSAF